MVKIVRQKAMAIILLSPHYNYARALQLEGTYPRDVGCSTISSFRVGFGWGWAPDDLWHPNLEDPNFILSERSGLDIVAKSMRSAWASCRADWDLQR